MMLRLFALRDTQTNKVLPSFFSNKPDARKERDRLNGGPDADKKIVITYGPDHRLFRS